MKRSLLICALTLLCAPAALAQSSVYRYDNFDTRAGVRIESVPTTAVLPPSKSVRPTSKAITPTKAEPPARTSSLVYIQPSSLSMAVSKSLDGFTTGDASVDGLIVEAGSRHGVDPVLIYALMHQESSFKSRAVSYKGARGLMQLMPGTAARFGVRNIFDPRQNIDGGTRYLRFLLDLFNGDVALALAGYNAGEGAVIKYGWRIPPYNETQEYVRRITRRYALMRDPEAASHARRLKAVQMAKAQDGPPVPLTIYEREVYAVRLPDGRLQLVSQ